MKCGNSLFEQMNAINNSYSEAIKTGRRLLATDLKAALMVHHGYTDLIQTLERLVEEELK